MALAPRSSLALTIATVLGVVLAACSPAPSTRTPCEAPPEYVVQAISEGLTVAGGGVLRDAQWVPSAEKEGYYFVAAEVDGPGIEGDGEIGVWLLRFADGSYGPLFAVNAEARALSLWGSDLDATEAYALGDEDAARDAVACVRAAQRGR